MKLSAFLMLILSLTSCAASQSTAPATPWKLELTTSGGITGRGNGSVSLDSGGALAVTTIANKSCSFEASADELRRFTELLAAARPGNWKESYAPENRCCDRIEYTLSYDAAGTVTKSSWIDDPLPMPDDLTALSEALSALKNAHACP
ncbi:MAG TPA: hypothetical protein VHW00_22370 [Thermoanaerobaculia bacterium]|nr:hypothetical protein [Thermoanaerobaculia bacterium]